ncbi:hypothetical protein IWW55_007087 [Coemansia sp. RSA 2706]|nr:hypothetical protein IWW55_007087 [Coemansia sp. RSA 2706]KAJ2305439.1 hypothetical protein IWW54_005077 [Coemansia sp. RSA 2705]KAJ2310809.1 hypothetical protein IWW51_006551 [Coemansia sp. RSA 2702]KAJ2312743.1 hypothetical protein IWW52_004769 [Coemansia sp. RSA 2704]KAJ2356289.1 hypothetical protein H4S02_012765 [Coemansia sp. RSA 2611]KAJ2362819.1 hypothetical protein H4S01_004602 [Coemansia sp. RSA 2610]KAJ2720399.1 hypothetical protein H4R23_004721 [Coemansia sp. Cherry 401B]
MAKVWWPKEPERGSGPIHLSVPLWDYDDRYRGQAIVPHVVTGPYHLVRNAEFLASFEIKTILCIRDPLEQRFLRGVDLAGIACEFLDVPADVRKANIIPYFVECARVIGEQVARGQTVLVCCSDGIDKSASFVAAYLMSTYGLRAVDAITFVQNQRYCATPSANGYRIKLIEYEPICAAAGVGAGAQKARRRADDDEEEEAPEKAAAGSNKRAR